MTADAGVPLASFGMIRKDHSLLSKMVPNSLEKESVLILAPKQIINLFYKTMLSRKNSIKKTVKHFHVFLLGADAWAHNLYSQRSGIHQFVAMTSSISIF